jgi:hypothetical protein
LARLHAAALGDERLPPNTELAELAHAFLSHALLAYLPACRRVEGADRYRREKHCQRSPIFSELRCECSSMITIRRIFMRDIKGFGLVFSRTER